MPRVKKYVADDGAYLETDERQGYYRIAWYFPDEAEFGAYVGDTLPTDIPPEKPGSPDSESEKIASIEIKLLCEAVKPYSCGRDSCGYQFETVREVKLALRAANLALNEGKPWPAWALKAKEAGWKPPKGWKP